MCSSELFGLCVKRVLGPSADAGAATYLYYDGWNLIQEGPSALSADRQYVHGARVDEVLKQITPPNGWERYFHYDASGNCTLQTDAGGNIVEQYEYDAFGFPYFYDASGTNIGYSPFGNRFLFTGREWLSDLKLYDYRNRMYQPELGRFMQPDPKEFAAGDYNLYRYCHNDPVNKTDPFGLAPTVEEMNAIDTWTGVKLMFHLQAPTNEAERSVAGIGDMMLAGLPSGGTGKMIQFSQRSISFVFRGGEFASKPISQVVQGLRSGAIKPGQLPIQTITRDGVTYSLNNRSLMALRQAGMSPTVVKDMTGNPAAEKLLTQRLRELGVRPPSELPRVRGQ